MVKYKSSYKKGALQESTGFGLKDGRRNDDVCRRELKTPGKP